MAEVSSNGRPPDLHPADVLEAVSDAIPDAICLVQGEVRRTRRDFDARAARLAQALVDAGVSRGGGVALYLHNSPAYLEAYFAALKMRGVPINANYRYVADELLYLLENSDSEAIFFDEVLAPRVAAVADRLPNIKLMVEVGTSGIVPGAHLYEELIAKTPPMPRIARDPGDPYMTYTGGTTGLPKGVRSTIGPRSQALMVIAAKALGGEVPTSPAHAGQAARRLYEADALPVSVVAPPFMHATGMAYGASVPLMSGGRVCMPAKRGFDAKELIELAQRERCTSLTVVGDVVARPVAAELERAKAAGEPYDVTSIRAVYSAGMIWTAGVKKIMLRHMPDAQLIDVVGSTEGHVGTSYATRDHVPDTGVFTPLPSTKVLTPDGRQVAPGSGERGMIACAGATVGAGYYKDPEKTGKTYRQIDGVNYVMAGDWATVEADGSIRFLGRDSSCINTGGEKVFAEEVENVILRMPGVTDCIVVGVPDERWGQVVGAVISAAPGASVDQKSVDAWVRTEIAGYKVPRRMLFLDKVPRAPNGKSDLAGAVKLLVDETAPEAIAAAQ